MNTPASSATLDQQRAKHAWQTVQDAKQRKGAHADQEPKKFGAQAKKLPSRIMTSGLGQALAFLRAKGYAPGLLEALNDWIARRIPPTSDKQDLLERIVQGDADFLRRATDEVLAYLVWLNRFADAEGLTDSE